VQFQIKYEDFDKAIAALEDFIFKTSIDSSDPEDLKLLKLIEAREQNPKFEYDLAEFICGEGENPFPYRSSYHLTEFFRNLGFRYQHDGTTRRFWVENVLKQLNTQEISKIIRVGLFNKRDFRAYARIKNVEFDKLYSSAISEFQSFIQDSINSMAEFDLALLLSMNVNTDLLFNQEIHTKDVELNKLIDESKKRFLNPSDKQVALEKIWDAFERLKTYYGQDKKKSLNTLLETIAINIDKSEFEKEFGNLTVIGNSYRIRHHEQGKIEIDNHLQIDYLYFRVLALIDLCIRVINKNRD
jgi:hypothetical protein